MILKDVLLWSLTQYNFESYKYHSLIKFIYSEKATKFCEVSTVDLTANTTQDKSTLGISQKILAFSDYMNFTQSKIYGGGHPRGFF